jgi:hypothetical protein
MNASTAPRPRPAGMVSALRTGGRGQVTLSRLAAWPAVWLPWARREEITNPPFA